VRVTYVLGHPTLGGGTKVVAQHATLLRDAGVDVTIVAQGPRPDWLPFTGPYIDGSTAPPRPPSQDIVIATFWTTIETARRMAAGPVAHFCQGYEGRLGYLRADWPQIESVYAARLPTLAVTPDLAAFLAQRFGRSCRVARPPIDPLFHPVPWAPLRHRLRRTPWVAIAGVYEADVKDVPTALRAVQRLRTSGRACRVLRFSSLPLSAEERDLLTPDRYLHAAAPSPVARALRGCDMLLFTSRAEEGFGLPLLEAMASGVPAVASRISSSLFMTRRAIPLVTAGDDGAFAAEARDLLDDVAHWERVRRGGIEAARAFAPEQVLPELLDAVRWAADTADDIEPDHGVGPGRRIT
jgi:glycosyltransferase involved in cell wall biosynthesis